MKNAILIIISFLGINSYSQTAAEYIDKGLEKSRANDYQGAVVEFDKAIAMDPRNASAYFYRGYSKTDLNQLSEAIQDYTKAIELDAKYEDAYFYRGYALLYSGKDKESLADFEQAVKLNPSARNYSSRGIMKNQMGMYKAAIEDFDQALRLDPTMHHAYFVRGYSRYGLGQHEEACLNWKVALILGNQYAAETLRKLCK